MGLLIWYHVQFSLSLSIEQKPSIEYAYVRHFRYEEPAEDHWFKIEENGCIYSGGDCFKFNGNYWARS